MRGQESVSRARSHAVFSRPAIPMRGQEGSYTEFRDMTVTASHPHEGSGEAQVPRVDQPCARPAIPMRGQESARMIFPGFRGRVKRP